MLASYWQHFFQGFQAATQTIPSLVYAPAYLYGITTTSVQQRFLGLGISSTQERALEQIAAHTVRMSAVTDDNFEGLYCGRDRERTIINSLSYWLDSDACYNIGKSGDNALRIDDWEQAIIHPGTVRTVQSFSYMEGSIDLYALPNISVVPAIAAILRFPHPPYVLYTLTCGLSLEQMVCKVVDKLLYKFYAYHMYSQYAGESVSFPQESWLRYASSIQQEEDLVPFHIIGNTSYHTDNHGLRKDAFNTSAEELSELRCRLKKANYTIYARDVLSQQIRQTGIFVITTKIDGLSLQPIFKSEDIWRSEFIPCDVHPTEAFMLRDQQHVQLSRLYHECSKIKIFHRLNDFMFPPHAITLSMQRLITQGVKDFCYAPLHYDLPDVEHERTQYIEECIVQRRSWSTISAEPITLQELAHLLHFSYGITGKIEDKRNAIEQPLRASPSGGALYPVDMYLLLHQVQGVQPGIYYYNPLKKQISLVKKDYSLEEIAKHTGYTERIQQVAAMCLFVGAFNRNQWKYRERGYRVTLLDCGHLAQNVLLVANGLGLVGHPIMGFLDDYFNDLINLDGIEESVLYLLLIGSRTRKNTDITISLSDL